MSWFKHKSSATVVVRQPHAYPLPDDDRVALAFVCTTCGRTDLPEAGDWDPPICQECDAAINEDAILEEVAADDD
jgi:hypothetical protein